MENKKQKRYYKINQTIWSVNLKKEVRVKSINIEDKEITVTEKNGKDIVEHTFKLWEVDVLKYAKAEELKSKSQGSKVTYFASVEGGVIPTKDDENAGRDCHARLIPSTVQVEVEDGVFEPKEIHETYLPKMQVSKIPLGFASYLNKEDLLSLNWERSSVGSLGILILGGLIDSTYQGEVELVVVPLLHNILITDQVKEILYDEEKDLIFYPATKAIAQAVVLPQSKAKDVHIPYDELLAKPSTRGTGGFGSTGK